MLQTAASRYQEVRNSTATPGDLLLALYDGLFRFLRGASLCLEKGERGRAGELISKSHAILSELLLALDHSMAPELCEHLEALYGFAMHRLTHANLRADRQAVEDVIRVLTPLREAWQQAVPMAARETAAARGR